MCMKPNLMMLRDVLCNALEGKMLTSMVTQRNKTMRAKNTLV